MFHHAIQKFKLNRISVTAYIVYSVEYHNTSVPDKTQISLHPVINFDTFLNKSGKFEQERGNKT